MKRRGMKHKPYIRLFDLLGEDRYRLLSRLIHVLNTDPQNYGFAYADRQADKLHTPVFADADRLKYWVADHYEEVLASINSTPAGEEQFV